MAPARRKTEPGERKTITIERLKILQVSQLAVEVVSGPDKGQLAELTTHDLSIGTHPSNQLALSDPTVSLFHCRLIADKDGVRIIDNRSHNGTQIEGVLVKEVLLVDTTRLTLGDTTIVARLHEPRTSIELLAESSFGGASGSSVSMRRVFALARQAAASDVGVLLLGDTGSGKGVLAKAIHDHSKRARRPFVVFDCGAASPTLIESALFGHDKGAFTGADSSRQGAFERAHGGTLFLDEIGELPPTLQPKLLRVLDSGKYMRLGGGAEMTADVRIIAATNRDLRDDVGDAFRSDLYFRLAVFPIQIPPLRDRAEDIEILAVAFLKEALGRQGIELGDTKACAHHFEYLSRRPWPGNARELRNMVERAVAMMAPGEPVAITIGRLVELTSSGSRSSRALPIEAAREEFDRSYLRALMKAAEGDINLAATTSEMHPKSLKRLLRKLGLS